MKPKVIVSGGQTGSDMGGLLGAEVCGITTTGYAPKGYRTENGCNYELRDTFGLIEHEDWRYNGRTWKNVDISDATVIFAENTGSVGTVLTIDICKGLQKPYFVYDMFCSEIGHLKEFLVKNKPEVLNIAGNRESVCKGIQEEVKSIIISLFKEEGETVVDKDRLRQWYDAIANRNE